MKVCILMGSPRKQGNTNALLGPFRQELEGLGAETETVWLHALEIRPCTACRACQRDWTAFGCAQRDDVPTIFDKVLACDLIVLATPFVLLRMATDIFPEINIPVVSVIWNYTGLPAQEMGQRIFELVLATASGTPSKSEQHGYGQNEFVPWQVGAVM